MKSLTAKQRTVLKLHSKGKKTSEIVDSTGFKHNSVDYALKSANKRIEKAIEIIGFAAKIGALNKKQISFLRTLDLAKI